MAIVQEWEDVRRERAELLARWEGREKEIVRLRAEVDRPRGALGQIREQKTWFDECETLCDELDAVIAIDQIAEDAIAASPPSAPTPRYDRATVEPTDMPGCAPHGSHGCKAFGDEVRRATVEAILALIRGKHRGIPHVDRLEAAIRSLLPAAPQPSEPREPSKEEVDRVKAALVPIFNATGISSVLRGESLRVLDLLARAAIAAMKETGR